MSENLNDIITYTLNHLKSRGLDEYEVFGTASHDNEIEVYQQDIESLSVSKSKGIGIRVLRHQSVGYAYTSNLSPEHILECIKRAISNAKVTHKDKFNYLPVRKDYLYQQKPIDLELLYDPCFYDYSIKDKIKAAKTLEAITQAEDKRIIGISNSSYRDSAVEVVLANSNGFLDSYKKSWCYLYVNAISRQGDDTSTGDYFSTGKHLGEINLEDIARQAAKRSTSLLGGRKIKSVKADILLDPLVAAQFLNLIAEALTADSVQKGKSLFKDKIGKKLFSLDIDIYDDGIMDSGLASAPFDGEGVFKGKTKVFDKGILKTYLYNTYTARKDNTKSTGNASRNSYRSVPSVGINNFYLEPKKLNFSQILSETGSGFYVMDIIGLHSGANAVTGDISVGAKGLWLEEGSMAYPVKEVTIATDFLSLLKSIKRVGNKLYFIPSSGFIGSPALLVDKIMISGT